jgi:non-specific serine/threonine protein kinase
VSLANIQASRGVREYAEALLLAGGEDQAVRGRHRDWCLAILRDYVAYWNEPAYLAVIDDELDNIRAGLRWSISQVAVQPSLRMAWQLSAYLYVRGKYDEGQVWLAQALHLPGAGDMRDGARALARAGCLAYCQGDFDVAEAQLIAAQAAPQLNMDTRHTALVLHFRADVAAARGDHPLAAQLFEKARALSQTSGDTELQAAQTAFLAHVRFQQGDMDAAERLVDEALGLAEALVHPWARSWAELVLGQVAAQRGDADLAKRYLEDAVAIHRTMGYSHGLVFALLTLAYVARDQGDAGGAASILQEGLSLGTTALNIPPVLVMREEVAPLLVTTQPLAAVRLAAAVDAQRVAYGAQRGYVEDERFRGTMEHAARVCDAAAFERAWVDGHRMTPAQANAEALRLAAELVAQASPADPTIVPL